jgi:outer membrane lipoprotein SlyB
MNAFLKNSAVAVAAVAACATALPASAQSYGSGYAYQAQHGYGYNQGYETSRPYYDQCVRDQRQRQVAGGLAGAAIGLLAGRGVASRRVRSEGGAMGAVLGAAVGAGIGGSTAACQPGHPQPYGAQAGYGYDNSRYDDRYSQQYGYDRGYDDQDRGYGYSQPVRNHDNTDQCRLVESNIRLPDGRVENRYVRACLDRGGRYRVVD